MIMRKMVQIAFQQGRFIAIVKLLLLIILKSDKKKKICDVTILEQVTMLPDNDGEWLSTAKMFLKEE